LALIPIGLARYRRHRQADTITVATLVWGVAAAANIIHFWLAELAWSKEYNQEIMTGYVDPKVAAAAAPAWPWAWWAILAAAYVTLMIFALLWKKPPDPPGE
jgi:H+/Cl- antiporter ClcA